VSAPVEVSRTTLIRAVWNIWKGYSGYETTGSFGHDRDAYAVDSLPEVFDLNHKVATSTQYPLRPGTYNLRALQCLSHSPSELIESTWYLYRVGAVLESEGEQRSLMRRQQKTLSILT
jgi:hypothetical protein